VASPGWPVMAPPRKRRRRSPGEGSVWPYTTKAGEQRYAIGYLATRPDGSRRNVTRRRGANGEKWTTYLAASKALREVLGHVDAGTPVITLSAYAHVLPGSQRDASDLFSRLVAKAAS
jgi:hypothetical protein